MNFSSQLDDGEFSTNGFSNGKHADNFNKAFRGNSLQEDTKPPIHLMKIGSFSFDLSYLKTRPGFIRLFQIIASSIAFFCAITASTSEAWESNSGTYIFFTIILAVGLSVGVYLIFTIIAQNRSNECCGFSWIFVELVYFGLFGGLIFLGSCLSANKASGDVSLTAASVFGFISVITYGASLYLQWKLKKKLEKEDSKDEKAAANQELSLDDPMASLPNYHTFDDNNELSFTTKNNVLSRNNTARGSMRYQRQGSYPSIGRRDFDDFENSFIRENSRRYSASDKDSAYSEGNFFSRQGNPNINRRMSSRSFDLHHGHQNQPVRFQDDPQYQLKEFLRQNDKRSRRDSAVFPQRLAATSLSNLDFGYKQSRMQQNYPDEIQSQASEIPGWLKAALEDDCPPESELNYPIKPTSRKISFSNRISTINLPPDKVLNSFQSSDSERELNEKFDHEFTRGYEQNYNRTLPNKMYFDHESAFPERRRRIDSFQNKNYTLSQFY